jgi:neural Wiskott-Aldrich syndrome protein
MSEAYAEPRGRVPHSANLAATLQRAAIYAEEQGHRLITLEHLMLALSEDPDAIGVLQMSGIDLDILRNETASLIGRIDDRVPLDSQIAPVASQALTRVIDAASSAAGSRRRNIDGGIVLAALIGEGSSAAAELLKVMGLTFDAAIKTMRPRAASPSDGVPRTVAAPRTASYRIEPVPQTRRPQPLPPRGPLAPSAHLSSMTDVPRTQRPVTRAQAPLHTPQPVPRTAALPPLPSLAPVQAEPELEPMYEDYVGSPADYVDSLQPDMAPAEALAPERYRDERAPRRSAEKPRKDGQTRKGEKRTRSDRAGERGPLILTLERRMRRGEPEMVEARLSIRSLDAITAAATGGVQSRDASFLTRALTVRLRAPEESATVETIAAETQWIDTPLGLQDDDFGGWRWTVVPHQTGRIGLRFSVVSRTIGADGVPVEQALPDQIVDVRVKGRPIRALARMLFWLFAFAAAIGVGVVAEHVFGILRRLLG